jgi:hypothetical protein
MDKIKIECSEEQLDIITAALLNWEQIEPYIMVKIGIKSGAVDYEKVKDCFARTNPPKPKRWRAEEGGKYWFVGSCGEVNTMSESNAHVDNRLYDSKNYFETMDLAAEQAKKWGEIFGGESEAGENG